MIIINNNDAGLKVNQILARWLALKSVALTEDKPFTKLLTYQNILQLEVLSLNRLAELLFLVNQYLSDMLYHIFDRATVYETDKNKYWDENERFAGK